MKVLVYGYKQEDKRIVSDKTYRESLPQWLKGLPVDSASHGFLPSPMKHPSGNMPEHKGLEIGYAFEGPWNGLPGWVGIERREDGYRVVSRQFSHAGGYYSWGQIDPMNPHGIGAAAPVTEDVISRFKAAVKFRPVDECLDDKELSQTLPFQHLL